MIKSSSYRRPFPKHSTHAAFPGMCLLPDGTLYHVWRDGPAHDGGTNGNIYALRSDQLLRPTGSPWLLIDWSPDVRDPSVTTLKNGSVMLTCFTWANPGCAARVATSTDNGATVGNWTQLGVGAYNMAITAPVIELGDGTLVAFTYGKLTSSQTYDSAYCWRTVNGTWLQTPVVMAEGGRDYQEPTVIKLRNGALLAAFRYGHDSEIGVNASTDGGQTWTAPTPKFPGWGRPTLIELATGPTICIYRDTITRDALYRVSPDRGGTWGNAVVLDSPTSLMTYAAAVEMIPGLASVTLGNESSDTSSTINALQLLDTP